MICQILKQNSKIKKRKTYLANINKFKKKQSLIIFQKKARRILILIINSLIKAFNQNKGIFSQIKIPNIH